MNNEEGAGGRTLCLCHLGRGGRESVSMTPPCISGHWVGWGVKGEGAVPPSPAGSQLEKGEDSFSTDSLPEPFLSVSEKIMTRRAKQQSQIFSQSAGAPAPEPGPASPGLPAGPRWVPAGLSRTVDISCSGGQGCVPHSLLLSPPHLQPLASILNITATRRNTE